MSDITYRPYRFRGSIDIGDHTEAASQRLKRAFHEAFPDLIGGPSAERLLEVSIGVWQFLAQKNKAYGDSALDPLRVFSKASTTEQLRVRLDDKLSRLSRGAAAGEDAEVDMVGYLILLLAARED